MNTLNCYHWFFRVVFICTHISLLPFCSEFKVHSSAVTVDPACSHCLWHSSSAVISPKSPVFWTYFSPLLLCLSFVHFKNKTSWPSVPLQPYVREAWLDCLHTLIFPLVRSHLQSGFPLTLPAAFMLNHWILLSYFTCCTVRNFLLKTPCMFFFISGFPLTFWLLI